MNYRRLGKTGLMISEVGFGGEWLERHSTDEVVALIKKAQSEGINILDCWMSNPEVRSNIGLGIKGSRQKWHIQGHIGSTWQDGQYVRTRDMKFVVPAFEDLLERLGTDYIDLGMIHFVDSKEDWDVVNSGKYHAYIMQLKENGTIKHIGLSTHNPEIAKLAAKSGYIEMILFSVNPAYDILPASEHIEDLWAPEYDLSLLGMNPVRAEVYRVCEEYDVGINVMKGFAGGRLFSAERSPFGVALTPVQCIHYCLTRPAVTSILCGYDTVEQIDEAVGYETASEEQKDYASVLAGASKHAYYGQCTYCGHCKPCPIEIDIAMVNKYYDLASVHETVPDTVRSHYELLDHHADECIGCQTCEARCPFGVKISERMSSAAELFKQNS